MWAGYALWILPTQATGLRTMRASATNRCAERALHDTRSTDTFCVWLLQQLKLLLLQAEREQVSAVIDYVPCKSRLWATSMAFCQKGK